MSRLSLSLSLSLFSCHLHYMSSSEVWIYVWNVVDTKRTSLGLSGCPVSAFLFKYSVASATKSSAVGCHFLSGPKALGLLMLGGKNPRFSGLNCQFDWLVRPSYLEFDWVLTSFILRQVVVATRTGLVTSSQLNRLNQIVLFGSLNIG